MTGTEEARAEAERFPVECARCNGTGWCAVGWLPSGGMCPACGGRGHTWRADPALDAEEAREAVLGVVAAEISAAHLLPMAESMVVARRGFDAGVREGIRLARAAAWAHAETVTDDDPGNAFLLRIGAQSVALVIDALEANLND